MPLGMIAVWRRWLVDNPNPPVYDDRVWRAMNAMLRAEIDRCIPAESTMALEICKSAWEKLYRDAQGKAAQQ